MQTERTHAMRRSDVRIGWTLVMALAAGALFPAATKAAAEKERLPVGEFWARRLSAPPKLDGQVSPGEWDEALMASGIVAAFDHKMIDAETTYGFGFDEKNLYFLARCTRGNREWKLWKTARENDAYSFGDPSIEIWVSPPSLVPETYQNIVNTYPAVYDVKNIPSRGYSAMGWSGRWTIGVTETETHYVIEASIPTADFGVEKVRNGDVWRLLLCRTAPGCNPRSQGSWSITQGFGEIPQYPKVHLMDDSPVLQVHSTISAFTGKLDFPMAVVAPRSAPAEVEIELRVHKDIKPADDDRVARQGFSLKAGERKEFRLAVDAGQWKEGAFTIVGRTKDGTEFFRQALPFTANGFVHAPPVRPEGAAPPEELNVKALYGPASHVILVKADILDLPGREKAAGAEVKVIDPANGRVLQAQAMPAFRHWYSDGPVFLDLEKVRPPLVDYPRLDAAKAEAGKDAPGAQPPEPMKLLVEVTVTDADGKALKSCSRELGLLRYRFEWSDNDVGITDRVLPPWTPVRFDAGTVGVWNRRLRVNGLGLLEGVDNGGVEQVRSMRLVATVGGQQVAITPSEPKLARRAENAVTVEGTGAGAGLKLAASTRVEFDGFVLSDLTIAPADPAAGAKIDKLTLEVVLPESEATHYCTTAGGWAAVHDETPAYWSSRQTASGLLIGDFVPYIWLTNSDRAFAWFADNDRGWITDDDKSLPTQEIVREGGQVTLKVHFVEMPAELKAPFAIRYGYQTFPSRPLPPGWRSIICAQGTDTLPSARNTYFWIDADWAVLWPYYCSPFPWHLDKSLQILSRYPRDSIHRPMVGSIAHSIGRYRDYAGHKFDGYVVDWGETPGDSSNANCTQGKGPADFRVWHYQLWAREGGFRGLYIDENYLGLESNFITGGAYVRPDGRVQQGYGYLGLREYYKRMKAMFHANDVPSPNLWMHVSSGAAFHAWLGDIFFEGENVEPTDLQYDYIEVLPAGRMRAIGSAACAGGAMTMMCQSQRHATVHEPKHTHQFVGWVMAHDVLPEQVRFYNIMAQEARLYADDVEFVGYWKADCPARTAAAECVVSVHKTAGRALLWIVNTARKDQDVEVAVDLSTLGLDAGKTVALNAETGEEIALRDGRIRVPVLQRDFVAVLLVARRALEGSESFRATFDAGRAEADEALGCCVLPAAGREAPALVDGAKGKALGAGFEFWPHLHLTDEQGRLAFDAKLPEKAGGTVLSAGRVEIALEGGKESAVVVSCNVNPAERDRRGQLVVGKDPAGIRTVRAPWPGGGWHRFELAWKGGKLVMKVDGAAAEPVEFAGFGIGKPLGKDLESVPRFTFGARGGPEAFDEIRCWRSAE